MDELTDGARLRPGRRIGRNLYIDAPDGSSTYVGVTDSAELSAWLCQVANEELERQGR